MHLAYLSVGANLGDPLDNCRQGIDLLCAHHQVSLVACSPFYKTEPVDYRDQNWFVNAALSIRTELSPMALLDFTQSIQSRLGRKSGGIRFGPRHLDLDIIFYDDLVMDQPRLVIPHPRMHKRRFVLQPICDIDPGVIHPVLGKSVQDLLNQVVKDGQDIQPCSSGC